jgi:uncharacterized protein YjbI with pentapeptide repeats
MNKLINIFGETIISGDVSHKELLAIAISNQLTLKGLDASGLDLSGIEVRGVDLAVSKLDKANISGSKFQDCNLSDTTWLKCNAEGAKFHSCNLSNSAFRNCRGFSMEVNNSLLYQSTFEGSNLNNSSWKESTLDYCDLSSCHLDNVLMLDQKLNDVNFSYAESANKLNLAQCELFRCDFVAVKGEDINLSRASLSNCNINYMELQEKSSIVNAIFKECQGQDMKMKGVNGDSSHFFGGTFKGLQCTDSSYVNSSLESDFSTSYFERCDLSNVSAMATNFTNGRFIRVEFQRANLGLANISNCVVEQSNFKNANLSLIKKTGTEFLECTNLGESVTQKQDQGIETFVVNPNKVVDYVVGSGKTQ